MNSTQLFLCFIGLIAALVSTAEARLPAEGIIGGENAQQGQVSYQISLQAYGQGFCGGCIVGERYVITAAHCVTKGGPRLVNDPFKVVAGIIDLNDGSTRKVTVDVAEIMIPKDYNPTIPYRRIIGDIAVLRLNRDIGLAFNPNIRKVNLPQRGQTYAGLKAVISGYGWNKIDVVFDPRVGRRVEKNGMTYRKLRFAEAEVLSEVACRRKFTIPPSNKHICATVIQRDSLSPEGICTGDSGGPLVYGYELIGVVSTSPMGCVETREPAVYTRVSEYLDFINKAMSGVKDSNMQSLTLRMNG